MSYEKHTLTYVFDAASGSTLGDTGQTTMTISDVRSLCHVSVMAGIGGTQAEVKIYGLGPDTTSMISAKGIGQVTNTTLQINMKIYADGTEIFNGMIYSAYANMNEAPEVGLIISAMCGLDIARKSTKDFSLKGKASAKDILNSLCTPFGYTVNTFGIDGYNGENSHFTGSPIEQIRQLCNSFNFSYVIEGKVITVWPNKSGIEKNVIATVSPTNGLIGYPVFTMNGISFQTTFTPLLAIGYKVQLKTSMPNMSGQYMNNVVEHFLSSWTKDGPWITMCQASLIKAEASN